MTVSVSNVKHSDKCKLALSVKVEGRDDCFWDTITYKDTVGVALRDNKAHNVHIQFFGNDWSRQDILKEWYLARYCLDCFEAKEITNIFGNKNN